MSTPSFDIDQIDFAKQGGLIPCIVQDVASRQVLMLGFQNAEALRETFRSGRVTFFSRTKNRLWTKGETSGCFLQVREIRLDCDQDTVLIFVEAPEKTCHQGNFSCFGEKEISLQFLEELFELILVRKASGDENSYVHRMFDRGLDRIAQKIGEEAVETVIAAKNPDDQKFVEESADLVFHLLLLYAKKGLPIRQLVEELAQRRRNQE